MNGRIGTGGLGIVAIDHVQLPMPPGGETEARRFYGEVLGLREIAKPPALAARGGCWFAGPPGVAIHLGVEARPDSSSAAETRAHPCLVVADLDAARVRLQLAAAVVEADDSGIDVKRCYTRDPFGNRIELLDAGDAGFSEVDRPV